MVLQDHQDRAMDSIENANKSKEQPQEITTSSSVHQQDNNLISLGESMVNLGESMNVLDLG